MGRKAGKFVKTSYDENNQLGIDILKKHIKKAGFKITNKEEDYGVDIVATKNGNIYHFEAEMKTGYPFTDRKSFRFPSVSFLARKEKWKELNFFYFVICKETGYCVVANSDIIFKPEYKENLIINTRDRKGEDEFYRVPKDKCDFIKLT